jgi:succinate-semialdehyde dehydrogenase/glutarate-semialdehyde dehydrogenase
MTAATDAPPSSIPAVDPATGESLGDVAVVAPDQVTEALRRARASQRDWGSRSVAERVRAMRPVLELLVERRDDVAELISRETGKPRFEALVAEVIPTLDLLDYYLRNAEQILAPESLKHRLLLTARSTVHHEPYGVVGLITPWNYPFFLTAGIGLSALIAGNAVLNKPSEFTPLVGLEVEKLIRDSGLPPALYQCLPGYGATGQAIVEAGCDKISFTGSVATGRRVAAACGERLIPVSLELGGKDPAIVLADADLDRAVPALTWGAFTNNGQVCASIERIYVQDQIAHEFSARLVDHVRRLRQGPDRAYDVDQGPMVNRMQYEKVKQQVDDAVAAGAKVLIGGQGREGEGEKGGYYYEATVISETRPDMSVQREETFGPVVTVVPVSGEEEAVKLANDSPYGLTASVWTRDATRGERMARRLHFGSVFVNEALVPSGAGEAPWGGVKDSGFGKTRGPYGLLEMSRIKHVSRDKFGKAAPVWFPYSKAKYRTISDFVPCLFDVPTVTRVKAGVKGLAGLILGRRDDDGA